MRVDRIELAGINGIELPDRTEVDHEFVLSLRVRVTAMQRESVDVASYGAAGPEILPGDLVVKLVALDGGAIDEVVS